MVLFCAPGPAPLDSIQDGRELPYFLGLPLLSHKHYRVSIAIDRCPCVFTVIEEMWTYYRTYRQNEVVVCVFFIRCVFFSFQMGLVGRPIDYILCIE